MTDPTQRGCSYGGVSSRVGLKLMSKEVVERSSTSRLSMLDRVEQTGDGQEERHKLSHLEED